ncbi:DUF2634 domain-containing protein [Clostridium sp. MB40-C1]|uniref:DUF2634 domain-containing protein n=1 Tax=Clostridium sp. MB40-C1 TaxID=3070996 RepID=UPI0027E004F2|nr:DUF2634 domain-containing protein [Clostridium sp. MB40-C1]WMJ80997.1 DUF2634 domain-containing protein [Clostridium sp. MB40-C1]
MMLPKSAEIDVSSILETNKANTDKLGISYLYDFKKGDFVIKDGKLVEISDIDALKQWIQKILYTDKFKFKIYEKKDTQKEYGVTIKELIVGHDLPQSFVESEIKREVEEALMRNPLIDRISNWNIEKSNPLLKISFKVNLINNDSFNEEVRY